MDHSRLMNSSIDNDEMMLSMMSTNTYVVGRPFDSYNALNASLLSELDMSNQNSFSSSMVLENPLMDISLLPIIGDDELETPIYIPNRTMSSTLASNQQKPNGDKKSNASTNEKANTVCSRSNGNSNAVPKFTPAPKKPTKSQLIYEKLKESMEKEKNKPKREVKSKVSESLKQFSAPKTISREPSALKSRTVSGSSQVKMRPPSAVSRPTSTVQSSATARKPVASPSRPNATRPNTIPLRPKSESNVKINGSKPQTPSKPPPSSKSSHSLSQSAANAEKKIQKLDKQLSILHDYAQYNGKGFEAMSLLFAHLNKMLHQKNYDLNCSYDELYSTGKANEELKSIINSHIEQSSKSMNEMNKNFELSLKEKTEDYENKIDFIKDQYQHQISVLERQLLDEKERHKIVPVSLKSGEPNVCKGDCNDEIRSLNMTIQLKNEEIHQLRSEARELELKNESLSSENKHIGALNSQLDRMNQYVRQARENEKLLTKDLTTIQNELMDMKRKNVDLQQRLDIFQYKMGEDSEMATSTHSNSSGRSTGTRSIHDPVFPGDRVTPDRPHSNSEMTMSTLWSSVMRRTKPKISQDEIYDEGGKIQFDESMSSMAESADGVKYASSESSKENNVTNDL